MMAKKMPSAEKQIFHINNTAHECNTIEVSPRHRFVSLLLLNSTRLAETCVVVGARAQPGDICSPTAQVAFHVFL